MCAKQSVNPNIYLLNAGLGSKLHPARLLRSPVLCESLFFGSSQGRQKPHIINILEITIVLWRPRFIPADMSTLKAIRRGAGVAESWLVPLLGLIRTAVLITPDHYHTARIGIAVSSMYTQPVCRVCTCYSSVYMRMLIRAKFRNRNIIPIELPINLRNTCPDSLRISANPRTQYKK